jgi:hypothetical protein
MDGGQDLSLPLAVEPVREPPEALLKLGPEGDPPRDRQRCGNGP